MRPPRPELLRAIGRWSLAGLVLNSIIGSGIFGLPSVVAGLLGRAGIFAYLIAAAGIGVIMGCFAEVASQFREAGGPYLYARTAFGDFIGFETGWMNWIARVTSLASLSNGFVLALAFFFPSLKEPIPRATVIIVSIVILAVIHILGVKYGAASIYVFTWGKLIPLIGFIVLSLVVFKHNPIPA